MICSFHFFNLFFKAAWFRGDDVMWTLNESGPLKFTVRDRATLEGRPDMMYLHTSMSNFLPVSKQGTINMVLIGWNPCRHSKVCECIITGQRRVLEWRMRSSIRTSCITRVHALKVYNRCHYLMRDSRIYIHFNLIFLVVLLFFTIH